MIDHHALRRLFLDYFQKNAHEIVPSSPLIPDDPTESNKTLFTTAGMQQFKRFYVNPVNAPASRAASIQKCIRTSDIDEVGDATHLTFFEMLGNFSFGYPQKEGSYFKEAAINFAWQFLTQDLKIDKSRLHATYFQGERDIPEDKESLAILQNIADLPRIVPQGFADNFWSLGTEGSPGGPTVEFYIDNVEVWNLVLNEYIFQNGKYIPSESKGVDTGMGLERLSQVINNEESVFHTDLFQAAHKILRDYLEKEIVPSERIILDHLRSAVFIISAGIIPSNKEQGYILRRLIRRAMIEGRRISARASYLEAIVSSYIGTYAETYPELAEQKEHILHEINQEAEKFNQTLEKGMREFEKQKNNLTGEVAFNLFQTYGFPWEITADLAHDEGVSINRQEFEKAFRAHQQISRAGMEGKFKGGLADTGEQVVKYHTATHLLHAALRQVLGEHVQQKGSNITAERLRFDFSHPDKMTPEQIKQVEDLINEQIQKDLPVTMEDMSPDAAKQSGALGFFEHKYGDKVKVYTIGNPSIGSGSRDFVSREICGGPHVQNTGVLGHFKIIKEEASSAGVRRIKAVLE